MKTEGSEAIDHDKELGLTLSDMGVTETFSNLLDFCQFQIFFFFMAFQWLKFALSLIRKVEHLFMYKCHLYFLYLDCIHQRRKWQPTPGLLSGEFQGRGSLVDSCLWGHTESDTTEAT